MRQVSLDTLSVLDPTSQLRMDEANPITMLAEQAMRTGYRRHRVHRECCKHTFSGRPVGRGDRRTLLSNTNCEAFVVGI